MIIDKQLILNLIWTFTEDPDHRIGSYTALEPIADALNISPRLLREFVEYELRGLVDESKFQVGKVPSYRLNYKGEMARLLHS